MHKSDVVMLQAQLNYTTLVELPDDERIVGDIYCGDRDNWGINDDGHNRIFVKPLGKDQGRRTDLYVLTAAGNRYAFLLKEVSKERTPADTIVTIRQGDADSVVAMRSSPRINTNDAILATNKQMVSLLEVMTSKAVPTAKQKGADGSAVPIHDYTWSHGKAAGRFGVSDIWHDDHATFIKAETQEAPALYEKTSDGKDALVEYTLANGVYTVNRILSAGYLRLGKNKLEFKREKS